MKCFSGNFKALIDTYDTLKSGMLNTIIVGKVLIEAGIGNVGVRLDSGDLCELSKQCRKLWKQHVPGHGFTILASDDLHEERLVEMEKNLSEIDVYAIGTNIATCKKQPALGLVCKLTEINKQPKMKFSADLEKTTLPGSKLIYRLWTDSAAASFDVIALEGESLKPGEAKFFSLAHGQEETHCVTKVELMNQPLELYHFTQTLAESRQHVQQSMEELPPQLFQLHRPEKFKVLVTETFASMLLATKTANALKL